MVRLSLFRLAIKILVSVFAFITIYSIYMYYQLLTIHAIEQNTSNSFAVLKRNSINVAVAEDTINKLTPSPDGNNCSERIYRFYSGSINDTVFTDEELWDRCSVNGSGVVRETNPFTSPQLITKCGVVDGKLLSARTELRPAESGFLVPNVVYYVWFGPKNFTFLDYISVKSADRYIRPKFIFIRGDGLVYGYWWERTLREIPNIYHVYHPGIDLIQDRKPLAYAHQSDIVRMHTVLANGGIYLDTDVIVLKSFDTLRRRYTLTMGRHSPTTLGNAVMIATPNQPLMCVWYNGYRDYNPNIDYAWGHYSMVMPHRLAQLLPQHIHVEEDTIYRPAWWKEHLPLMFGESNLYDWTRNYAMHIWIRNGPVPKSPEGIVGLKSTLGEVMRHIYYG